MIIFLIAFNSLTLIHNLMASVSSQQGPNPLAKDTAMTYRAALQSNAAHKKPAMSATVQVGDFPPINKPSCLKKEKISLPCQKKVSLNPKIAIKEFEREVDDQAAVRIDRSEFHQPMGSRTENEDRSRVTILQRPKGYFGGEDNINVQKNLLSDRANHNGARPKMSKPVDAKQVDFMPVFAKKQPDTVPSKEEIGAVLPDEAKSPLLAVPQEKSLIRDESSQEPLESNIIEETQSGSEFSASFKCDESIKVKPKPKPKKKYSTYPTNLYEFASNLKEDKDFVYNAGYLADRQVQTSMYASFTPKQLGTDQVPTYANVMKKRDGKIESHLSSEGNIKLTNPISIEIPHNIHPLNDPAIVEYKSIDYKKDKNGSLQSGAWTSLLMKMELKKPEAEKLTPLEQLNTVTNSCNKGHGDLVMDYGQVPDTPVSKVNLVSNKSNPVEINDCKCLQNQASEEMKNTFEPEHLPLSKNVESGKTMEPEHFPNQMPLPEEIETSDAKNVLVQQSETNVIGTSSSVIFELKELESLLHQDQPSSMVLGLRQSDSTGTEILPTNDQRSDLVSLPEDNYSTIATEDTLKENVLESDVRVDIMAQQNSDEILSQRLDLMCQKISALPQKYDYWVLNHRVEDMLSHTNGTIVDVICSNKELRKKKNMQLLNARYRSIYDQDEMYSFTYNTSPFLKQAIHNGQIHQQGLQQYPSSSSTLYPPGLNQKPNYNPIYGNNIPNGVVQPGQAYIQPTPMTGLIHQFPHGYQPSTQGATYMPQNPVIFRMPQQSTAMGQGYLPQPNLVHTQFGNAPPHPNTGVGYGYPPNYPTTQPQLGCPQQPLSHYIG